MEQQQANAVTLTMTPEAISAMLSAMYLKDADFRAEFDRDPKAAIAKVAGQKMASDAEVVVHRNEDKRWHITLPSQEAVSLLSDREISGVSGGTGQTNYLDVFQGLICGLFCDGTQSGGSGLSAEDAATVTDAITTLTDNFTELFGNVAFVTRGGSGGGTP